MANTPNMVVWFEIPTYDLERAKTFYEGVLDVQLDLRELGPLRMAWFPMEEGGQGSAGCLVHNEAYEPSHAGTLVYIHVNDMDAALDRIPGMGGKILNPKTAIGEHGFVAHLEDTEGNRVALHSDK
jgi:predicted enzyme related to lactoylglutathione lyase